MSIYNTSAIKKLMPRGNHYSYTRLKNLLAGLKGETDKKEIKALRKILKDEWESADAVLEKLENE